MGGLLKNNCVAEAMKLFHSLERYSFNLGIDTYNCVLDRLCKVGELNLANELYAMLPHNGLEPTAFTYNIIWSMDFLKIEKWRRQIVCYSTWKRKEVHLIWFLLTRLCKDFAIIIRYQKWYNFLWKWKREISLQMNSQCL